MPYALLEGGAAGLDRDAIDRGEVAAQVRANPRRDTEWITGPLSPRAREAGRQLIGHARAPELERAEPAIARGDHDAAKRARDLVDQQYRTNG
jgi:hypothetical protein